MDADGQHNPKYIKTIVKIFKNFNSDFCKGYRDQNIETINSNGMPLIRFLGAWGCTMLTRIVTGNYSIKDAPNGLFGIKKELLKKIDLKKVRLNYFFEQDIIFHVCLKKAKINQFKTIIKYGSEKSNLQPVGSIPFFLIYHLINFTYKNFYLKK